MKGEEIPLEA
ncbi:hypothetical protein CN563_13375 [Bacillus sp. AFS026049]|nr:hypothetical protein CN563_13375 [Bacillus sp. AFS026049]